MPGPPRAAAGSRDPQGTCEFELPGRIIRERKRPQLGARIDIPKDEIAAFCRRNRILRMAFFGSVLRDDFSPESDVDLLVEFEPDARIGYIGLAGLEIELGEVLGRRADLHTLDGVQSSRNWLLRDEILGSTEAVYEQARLDDKTALP